MTQGECATPLHECKSILQMNDKWFYHSKLMMKAKKMSSHDQMAQEKITV